MKAEDRIDALRNMRPEDDWGDKFYAALEALEQVIDGRVIARTQPPHVVMARLIDDVRVILETA